MPYETRNCRYVEPASQSGEQSSTLTRSETMATETGGGCVVARSLAWPRHKWGYDNSLADFDLPTRVTRVTLSLFPGYGNVHCAHRTTTVIQLNSDARDHGDEPHMYIN